MPAGTAPDIGLALDVVFHRDGQLGAFAPRMEDVSRVGLDNMTFVEAGQRGDRTTVQARQYVADESAGYEHLTATEALQGRELTLSSTIDGWQWMVFLHRVTGGVRKIGSATVPIGDQAKTCECVVVYNLELQRTY
jgi:hypothetical protein